MNKENKNWLQSRRKFVENSSFLVGATFLPWFQISCNNLGSKNNEIYSLKVFENNDLKIIEKIHNVLFPNDIYGPGAIDFKTAEYLDWVLSDTRIDLSEKEFILNGLKWIKETSIDEFNEGIDDLSEKELSQFISTVSKTNWGENWLSRNLTYILEAQFADSLYGHNTDGIGWKWLNHYPGYPRPSKDMIYDKIYETLDF